MYTVHTCGYLFLLTLYLGNVVLVCLGRKVHGCHGHHDGLVGGINRSRGGLWAWPNGGAVGRKGGPCCLHLSPVEELWRKSKNKGKGPDILQMKLKNKLIWQRRKTEKETEKEEIQVSVDIRQFTSGHPAVSVRQFIQIIRHLNLQLIDNLKFRHWNSSDHKCLMNYINSAHRTDTKKHKHTHIHT